MKISYRQQIDEALRAVTFRSPATFLWFREPIRVLPRGTNATPHPAQVEQHLIGALQLRLYENFYIRGTATPLARDQFATSLTAHHEYVRQLSRANAGSGRFEDGWKIQSNESGRAIASDSTGFLLGVDAGDCQRVDADGFGPGGRIRLRWPKESLHLSPGFYVAFGNQAIETNLQPLVRLYWNVGPPGGIGLIGSVTAALNEAGEPFQIKVLNHPERFGRADAVVLYLPRIHYARCAPLLAAAHAALRGHFRPRIPAFTKPIAFGVGLAEDPGADKGSFGLHRCGLLASGLVRGRTLRPDDLERRAASADVAFRSNGIDPDTPYLEPGSSDAYDTLASDRAIVSGRIRPRARARIGPGDLFAVAESIGDRLCESGIWYERRCAWWGLDELSKTPSHGVAVAPLGASLYSGTSGVAVFLAELARLSGNRRVRSTAIGAGRQAGAALVSSIGSAAQGLYTGLLGATLGLARVGLLLDDSEMLGLARELLATLEARPPRGQVCDLLSGMAGDIVALLLLGRILGCRRSRTRAERLGDYLLSRAHRTARGYSWPSAGMQTRRNLTGFSHGAAGIGYALVELYSDCRDDRYRDAALRAFDYERSFQRESEAHWPDFRSRHADRRIDAAKPSYGFAWCHGAPGIALSRLRGWEILREDSLRGEAIVALDATMEWCRAGLESSETSLSLCHGVAGNADILLSGRRTLDWPAISEEGIASLLAEAIDRHQHAAGGRCVAEIPPLDRLPGLMLGVAGVGLALLRAVDPSVVSVLLVDREGWTSRPRAARGRSEVDCQKITVESTAV